MTEDEIFTTTGLNRDDSKRVAAALAGEPAFMVSIFWEMLKTGVYSPDEMVSHLAAIRSLCC